MLVNRKYISALFLLSVAVLSAKENTISLQDAREGWVLLFDGESLMGWSQDFNGKWKIVDGALVFEAPDAALLRTTTPFTDFTLRFDFRAPDVEKAGDVYLRIPIDGNPADNGYALHHGNSLATITKPESPAPSAGAWHTSEIEWSGDHYSIKLDGRKVTDGKDARSKAGYLALEGKPGAKVEYRNLRMKMIGAHKLFNGSELAGWKSANATPVKPGGSGANPIKKIFKLGGGGAPKVKEASWSVMGGQIHGAGGPGQLETETLYDDFLLQVDLRADSKKKKPPVHAAVYLRGDPGQLFSGYEVLDGGLAGLKAARRSYSGGDDYLTETVAAHDRHFEIWVNGYPATEYTDPRADSTSAKKGSRITPGAIALEAPAGEGEAFFRNISVTALPKTFGGDMKAVGPPKPAPADITSKSGSPSPIAVPAAPGMDPAMAQLMAKDEQKKARISALTGQSLATSDPHAQVRLNQEILTLDPTNLVALQNYNQAKGKLESAAAQQQKQTEEQTHQEEKKSSDASQFSDAMSKGEAAIVAGNLTAASRYLGMADRLMPGNPQASNLRRRIDDTINFRQRLRYIFTGAGAITLLAGISLWFRSRGKKIPYLEVIEGVDQGKRYTLDKEISHIGAVAEDGGAKNEIVVRDAERLVSRFHCEIHNQKGKLYLVDLNSSNGTAINGKPLTANKAVPLKNGAKVHLGRACSLRVGFEKQKK